MKRKDALRFRGARAHEDGQRQMEQMMQEQLHEEDNMTHQTERQGWTMRARQDGVQFWQQQGHPWNHVSCYAGSAETAIELAENLPHGSGIDYAWHIDQKSKDGHVWILSNSYHGMDEHGGYVHAVPFTVTLIKRPDGSWHVADQDVDAPDFDDWAQDWTYPDCWIDLDDYLATTIEQTLNA